MFVSNQPQGPARLQNTEKAGTLQAHYIKVGNSWAFHNTKLRGYKNITNSIECNPESPGALPIPVWIKRPPIKNVSNV